MKRFTDTEKWRKNFMKKLSSAHKLLFLYILDECDAAGVWDVELDVASVRIGETYDYDEAVNALSKHIIVFDDGKKWFVPEFIRFQYGELSCEVNPHRGVIKKLSHYVENCGLSLCEGFFKGSRRVAEGLPKGSLRVTEGFPKGIYTLQDKDKDKDKDKEEDNINNNNNNNININNKSSNNNNLVILDRAKSKKKFLSPEDLKRANRIYEEYPRHVAKKKAIESILKAMKKIDPSELFRLTKKYASLTRGKQHEFIPYPATWYNQERWNDEDLTNPEKPLPRMYRPIEENLRTYGGRA